ncbi:hypothetical protein NQ318_006301 [Aromia moschata]|uniref:Uncharacterized protein n=1 Tax=Aromia moschata TaxID=1265417 RepID=A0AAV8YWT3_9CUCU|nr:hypothetical protein NQ318_006301 [Aromia moschata]
MEVDSSALFNEVFIILTAILKTAYYKTSLSISSTESVEIQNAIRGQDIVFYSHIMAIIHSDDLHYEQSK